MVVALSYNLKARKLKINSYVINKLFKLQTFVVLNYA